MTATGDDCHKTDRKQWLIDNKLEDVITVFEKRNVEIEELLEFEKDDLMEFAKDILHLDVLARNRFIKAINKLTDKKNKNNKKNKIDFNFNFGSQSSSQHSTVISQQEHKAKESLFERNNEIAKLCYDIKNALNDKLNKSYCNVLIEIGNIFDLIINKLNKKKQELIINIDNIEKQKTDKLQKQLKLLNDEYLQILNNTKQEYYKYMEDKNVDIKSRKRTVLTLISNVLNDNKYEIYLTTTPNIQFVIAKKLVNGFLDKMEINNCDQPNCPCICIMINKCTSATITIKWEFEIYKVHNIQIQYALLPKQISKAWNDNSGDESDNDDGKSDLSETDSTKNSDTSMHSSGYNDTGYDKTQKRIRKIKKKKRKPKKNGMELPNDINIDSLKWKVIEKRNKNNYYAIKELHPDRFYVFRVRGCNENGYGKYSKCIVGKTEKLKFKSKIMNGSEERTLLNILQKNKKKIRVGGQKISINNVNKLEWKLLFRASKYNYNCSEFYRKCCGKENTLTIAVSELNYVFGAYVNVAWTRPPNGYWAYGDDKNAFLFILRSNNKSDIGCYNIMKQYSQYAMCNWDQYGPCFGQNCEIAIANNCNVSQSNYCMLGTYQGITNNTQLAGSQYFKVSEYEVWQLLQ